MSVKSSVAIDTILRKKLKKLAALLDMTQAEIISHAIDDFEKKILFSGKKIPKNEVNPYENSEINQSPNQIAEQLHEATSIIWQKNPAKKKRQLKLYSGPETIDDFIISSWESGLDL